MVVYSLFSLRTPFNVYAYLGSFGKIGIEIYQFHKRIECFNKCFNSSIHRNCFCETVKRLPNRKLVLRLTVPSLIIRRNLNFSAWLLEKKMKTLRSIQFSPIIAIQSQSRNCLVKKENCLRHKRNTRDNYTHQQRGSIFFHSGCVRLDPENYSDNSVNYDNFLHTRTGTPQRIFG